MNRLSLFLSATALLLMVATNAFAHADLVSSDPASGATIAAAPAKISITFTEEVAPKFSGIEVLDPMGMRADDGAAQTNGDDAKVLSVGLKAMGSGVYKVNWHATAADDGHKTKGTYQFTVKP